MIILIYGLPGTGKTFFSEFLARETGAVHLNTDFVRERLDSKGRYDDTSKQQVYNELYKQVMLELKDNKDVIVDGTFHKQIRREQVKKIASEMNKPFFLIEMKANEKAVKKRLKKSRKHSEAGFDVYKSLERDFEVEPDNHLVLWSDEHSMEELISKAKRNIYG